MTQWVKDTAALTPLGTSAEAPLHEIGTYLTPVDKFFICNVAESQRVDPATYRLELRGDALAKPLTLSLADLEALPQHEVPAYIECAGNQRTLFNRLQNERIERESAGDDVPWTLGGVSMAVWAGPRLADVLALAGLSAEARWVAPCGLDVDNPECPIEIPMPLKKALHPDTILALSMNGEPLPPDHGFPVRAIVPGWIGTYSVKWVGWITVSADEIRNYRTDEYYVIDGQTVTRQNIKSSLALPFPARLEAGTQRISGFARAPDSLIDRVEWSDDGGEHWHEAEIVSPNERYGWVRFAFDWKAASGHHRLLTRATDENGDTQPERSPFNPSTLLFNAIIAHPITVT